ncbi:hypothetical protein BDV95DRAFT_571056 [Massariosphaeria phaeospora]|uniref:Uncharacterized protein n=1 Tax=Massariosphaeria phaeospora TaxID=100035 RepID=A0A7C8M6I4_9PLEO|nr:hypothetical protein BDV95DRAFT_571056 [Massariosphaeria phaeospora]
MFWSPFRLPWQPNPTQTRPNQTKPNQTSTSCHSGIAGETSVSTEHAVKARSGREWCCA